MKNYCSNAVTIVLLLTGSAFAQSVGTPDNLGTDRATTSVRALSEQSNSSQDSMPRVNNHKSNKVSTHTSSAGSTLNGATAEPITKMGGNLSTTP